MIILILYCFRNTFKEDVKKRCKNFLAEVISTLCFPRYHESLHPALIEDFIRIVLNQQMPIDAKKKAPFSVLLDVESTTTIRSFLLQLLLDYK